MCNCKCDFTYPPRGPSGTRSISVAEINGGRRRLTQGIGSTVSRSGKVFQSNRIIGTPWPVGENGLYVDGNGSEAFFNSISLPTGSCDCYACSSSSILLRTISGITDPIDAYDINDGTLVYSMSATSATTPIATINADKVYIAINVSDPSGSLREYDLAAGTYTDHPWLNNPTSSGKLASTESVGVSIVGDSAYYPFGGTLYVYDISTGAVTHSYSVPSASSLSIAGMLTDQEMLLGAVISGVTTRRLINISDGTISTNNITGSTPFYYLSASPGASLLVYKPGFGSPGFGKGDSWTSYRGNHYWHLKSGRAIGVATSTSLSGLGYIDSSLDFQTYSGTGQLVISNDGIERIESETDGAIIRHKIGSDVVASTEWGDVISAISTLSFVNGSVRGGDKLSRDISTWSVL